MRLFVAIAPPPDALSELERAVAPLRPAWPALRWVGQERWHVTLAFLGDVDERRLDGLLTRLGRAAGRHRQAEVAIGEGGAFPSAGKARVLCVHLAGPRAELDSLGRLAASVAAAARRAGAPSADEGRRYRPHVTLARSRQPADLRSLVDALRGFSGSAWRADQIHLIRSQTGPRPSYETVASWPLRQGAARGPAASGPAASGPAASGPGARPRPQDSASSTPAAPGTSRTERDDGPT